MQQFSVLNYGGDKNLKGLRAAPSKEDQHNRDNADVGQMTVKAARKANNHMFRIEWNDKPVTGASPKNSIIYLFAYWSRVRQ